MSERTNTNFSTFFIFIGIVSISLGIVIAIISYNESTSKNIDLFQQLYLTKAKMFAEIIQNSDKSLDEKSKLELVEAVWDSTGQRPKDQYICVIDSNSNLIYHSSFPNTVGNYVGKNKIVYDGPEKIKCLSELAELKQDYVGEYISSNGELQIAAFVYLQSSSWIIGIHRSKVALLEDVSRGSNTLMIGFLSVAGVLMPFAFLLIYRNFRKSNYELLDTQHSLIENNQKYRQLFENSNDANFLFSIIDDNSFSNFIQVNEVACKRLSYTKEEMSQLTIEDINKPAVSDKIPNFINKLKSDRKLKIETEHVSKSGEIIPVEISSSLININGKELVFASARDITERTKAEKERKTHIRFWEHLEKINQVIRRAENIEDMMTEVLEVVRNIFECDRAWLLYPCDPFAESWHVPMEMTSEEYPGAFSLGHEIEMSDEMRNVFQKTLESPQPIVCDSKTKIPLPEEISVRFSIKSIICTAVYPKHGKPWHFGLHQCSYQRDWTYEEIRLFKEIGYRISDSLSNLLFLKNLQESEEKFKGIFESITDVFFRANLDGEITIVSPSVQELFGYKPDEVLGRDIIEFCANPEEKEPIMKEIQTNGFINNRETVLVCKNGERKIISTNARIVSDKDGKSFGFEGISRDVTDKKTSEDALRESQRALSTLMSNLPGMAYRCRNDNYWTMEFVSDGIFELTGYYPNDILKNNIVFYSKLIHPDDKQYVRNKVRSALIDNETFHLVYRIITKNKKVKWVWERGCGIYSANNELLALEGFIADITEQKETEAALKEKSQILQTLIDTIPAPIYYKDENLFYTGCNKAFEKYSGKSKKDIIGRNVYDIYSQELADKFQNADLELMKKQGTQNFDFDMEYADGSNHSVVFHKAIFDQKIGGMAGVIIDITERKKAEIALRKSNRRFSLHLKHTPLAVVEFDTNMHINDWNRSAKRIFGFSKEEVLGKNILSFLVPELDKKEVNETINKILDGGDIDHSINTNITKDGHKIICNWYYTLITNENNKIISVAAIIEDITESVKAEEELIIYRSHLENLVERRTAELNDVNAKLAEEILKQKVAEEKVYNALAKERELSELKSRFISTASHEFRTPLTTISSSVDLMETFRKRENFDKYYNHIEKIKRSIKYLTSLIEDVLVINKTETGKMIFSPQMINLKTHSQYIFDEIQSVSKTAHNCQFIYNDESEEMYHLDKKLIKLILSNLLSNAIKYSPKGGDVKLEIFSKKNNLYINVSDEGLGISSEDQKIIFEQFERGQNIENIHGSGLGLAIVQRAVELHGGEIDYKTELGKGTIFTVSIPLKTMD